MEWGVDDVGHVKEGQRKPVLVFCKTTVVGRKQEAVAVVRPVCGPGHRTYVPSSGPPSLAHLLGLSETIQKVGKMQENQERESKGKGELQGGGVLVNRFFRVCIQIPDG